MASVVFQEGRKARTEEKKPTPSGKDRESHPLKSPAAFLGLYLELPQGIITFFLAWSLLGTQSDELIDALGHSSVTETDKGFLFYFVKINSYFMFTRNTRNSL